VRTSSCAPLMGLMFGWCHLHLILKWQHPFNMKYLQTCRCKKQHENNRKVHVS
jgi:hypothetical protein